MADEITTEDILRQYGLQQPEKKDEHGFLFSNIGGQLKFNPWESIKGLMSYRGAPGHLSTSGDLQPIRDAADTAGWVGMPGLGLNYAGVMPTNIVGAAGGKLASKAATELPARELDPLGFYSAALEGAKSWPMERGSPAQALAHLKKSGTKEAEIAATGLDKYLAEQDVVTRQALEQYLRENRVNVRESAYEAVPQDAKEYGASGLYGRPWNELTPDEQDIVSYEMRRSHHQSRNARAPKWAEYSLDSSNPTYRESVVHLPSALEKAGGNISTEVARLQRQVDEAEAAGNYALADQLGVQMDRLEGLNDITGGSARNVIGATDFQSGHWSEPNVVAHMRTSMQPDEAGRPTFLIDELQSDWGQAIRDKGTRSEADIALTRGDLARVTAERDATERAMADFLVAQGGFAPELRPADAPNYIESALRRNPNEHGQKLMDDWFAQSERIGHFNTILNNAGESIAGHPLVNTTDQWTTTAIRRLLQQAAEADAAGIALTPGQLQNERFGLSNKIDDLFFDPIEERLMARRGDTEVFGEHVPSDKLHEYVGKETAGRLLSEPLTHPNWWGSGLHHLNANGLEIGGNGMRYAYDQMYPKKVAKELKKLDPDHPGVTQRHLVPTDLDTKGMINVMGDVDRMSSQYQAWQRYKEGTPYENPFHYFELTPRVKEEIRKGLPLFEAGLPIADLLRAYYGDDKEKP